MASEISNSILTHLFQTQGEKITLAPQAQLEFSSTEFILWQMEGEVELYLHTKPSKTFLGVFKNDVMIFPLSNKAFGKVLKTTTYYKIPIKLVLEISKTTPSFQQEMLKRVTQWIAYLSKHFTTHYIPQTALQIDERKEIVLAKEETITPSHQVKYTTSEIMWIKVIEGKVAFLGIDEVEFNPEVGLFPLFSHAWIKGKEQKNIVKATHLSTMEELWSGLLFFNEILIKVIQQDKEKQEKKETALTQLKRSKDAELFNSTLKEFGEILEDDLSIVTTKISSEPIMKACHLIGHLLQLEFQQPNTFQASSLMDCVHEIAQASQINYRTITLKNEWWREDHGPMLGFIQDDSSNPAGLKPVVLVHEFLGGYSLIDPEKPTIHHKVDANLNRRITPSAKIFYRQFSSKDQVSNRDIINFCLHGRGKDFFVILFASLVIAGLTLFLPIANQILFDYIIPYRDDQLFSQLLTGLILIYLSIASFNFIKEYAVLKAETFLNHDLEVALWDRLLNLPVRFFRKFTIGDLLNRLSSITAIRRLIAGQVVRVMINGVFSTAYLVVMFYYSPTLALIGLGFLILGLLVTLYGFTAMKKCALQYQPGVIDGKVIQMIMGISKIRTNGAEKRIFRNWAEEALKIQKLNFKMGTIGNRIHVTNSILDKLKYFVVFFIVIGWAGIYLSTNSPMISLGAYLAFSLALSSFTIAIADLNNVILETPSIYAFWQYAKVFLLQPTESASNKITPGALSGSINIDHVSFRYENNTPWIHENVSMQAKPGEFIAIVGASGCGKSSLIRLLLGFESPEKGAIYFDGQDLATLDLREVRSQICTIMQNSLIMDGTIRDNITGGIPYPLDDIMEAVKLAGFEEDLAIFPMGLNTVLVGGGMTISGGQRQRLFLARAFLSKATMMIWDEATTGLDNRTQEVVVKNLEKLNTTRIVVAHRLTSVRNADRIYVLEKGKVVEQGTFAELAKNGGVFSTMLAKQTL